LISDVLWNSGLANPLLRNRNLERRRQKPKIEKQVSTAFEYPGYLKTDTKREEREKPES
jgi:hypothetical protein